MSLIYLPWGILIGLIMAAPLGPVNIICLRRALSKGPMNGFIVGLGAALADGIFGTMAAFGLLSVTKILEELGIWVEVAGGIILIVVALKLWFAHPHLADVKDSYKDRIKAAIGTFFLTMTNPMTVVGFVALFVGLGLGDMGRNYINAALMSIGILLGSVLWWAILSVAAGKITRKLSDKHLANINKISAAIIFAFGSVAIIKNMIL